MGPHLFPKFSTSFFFFLIGSLSCRYIKLTVEIFKIDNELQKYQFTPLIRCLQSIFITAIGGENPIEKIINDPIIKIRNLIKI